MSDTSTEENHSWLKGASTKSDEVEVYYDDWAEKYDRELAEWDYKAPDEAAKMLQNHIKGDAKILDAGCGTGLTGTALRNAGFTNITGIDISAQSLPVAERTDAYVSVRQQDLQQLPFPFETDEFDAVNCVGVLTYIEDPGKLFEEYCRLVRSGGTFFLRIVTISIKKITTRKFSRRWKTTVCGKIFLHQGLCRIFPRIKILKIFQLYTFFIKFYDRLIQVIF